MADLQSVNFEQVVQGILSADNATRTAAEDVFKRLKGQPDFCVQQLMVTLEGSQAPDSRNLCAVLLRKVPPRRLATSSLGPAWAAGLSRHQQRPAVSWSRPAAEVSCSATLCCVWKVSAGPK